MSVFAADEEHQARLAEQLMQDRERQRHHEKSREMELDWERKHKREMQEDQIVEAQIERQIARDRKTTEHLSHLPDWRVALAEGAASASHAAHMGDDPKIKGAPPKSSPRVSFANHRTRLPDSDIPSRGDEEQFQTPIESGANDSWLNERMKVLSSLKAELDQSNRSLSLHSTSVEDEIHSLAERLSPAPRLSPPSHHTPSRNTRGIMRGARIDDRSAKSLHNHDAILERQERRQDVREEREGILDSSPLSRPHPKQDSPTGNSRSPSPPPFLKQREARTKSGEPMMHQETAETSKQRGDQDRHGGLRPTGVTAAVTKKGWFQKRGQPPFTDFKTRFFVLQGSDVRYYASEDDYDEHAAPKGSFSCIGLEIGKVPEHSQKHGYHFVLYADDPTAGNKKKEIECACSTDRQRAEWLAAFEAASHAVPTEGKAGVGRGGGEDGRGRGEGRLGSETHRLSEPQAATVTAAVTKKGWFQKRGQPPFTDFKTRFFVLQGSDVRYYASEDDYDEHAAPKGSFSCIGLEIGKVPEHSQKHGYHFVLYADDPTAGNKKKEIECACSTDRQRAEWLAAFEAASHAVPTEGKAGVGRGGGEDGRGRGEGRLGSETHRLLEKLKQQHGIDGVVGSVAPGKDEPAFTPMSLSLLKSGAVEPDKGAGQSSEGELSRREAWEGLKSARPSNLLEALGNSSFRAASNNAVSHTESKAGIFLKEGGPVRRGTEKLAIVNAKRAEAQRAEEEATHLATKAKLTQTTAIVRLTLGKEYEAITRSTTAEEAFRLKLLQCVAQELHVKEELVAIDRLARHEKSTFQSYAEISLVSDPTGRDQRDAAALAKSLRDVVGNPMSSLAQTFSATRAQQLSTPDSLVGTARASAVFGSSGKEAGPGAGGQPPARQPPAHPQSGSQTHRGLVVAASEAGLTGARERHEQLSHSVAVFRQSPPPATPRQNAHGGRERLQAVGAAGGGYILPERLVEVHVEGASYLPTMHLWTSSFCQLELASSLLDELQVQCPARPSASCVRPVCRRPELYAQGL